MTPRTAMTDRQIAVRVPQRVVDQLTAAQSRLGAANLADTTRRVLDIGLEAEKAGTTPRPPRERSPEDHVRTFEVLVDLLNDLLDDISDAYPMASIVMAHNAGVGFSTWAELEAERLGTTVEAAIESAQVQE